MLFIKIAFRPLSLCCLGCVILRMLRLTQKTNLLQVIRPAVLDAILSTLVNIFTNLLHLHHRKTLPHRCHPLHQNRIPAAQLHRPLHCCHRLLYHKFSAVTLLHPEAQMFQGPMTTDASCK